MYRESLELYGQVSDEDEIDSQFVAIALEEMAFRRRGAALRWLDIGCGNGAKIKLALTALLAKPHGYFRQWMPRVELIGVDPRAVWKDLWKFPDTPNIKSEFVNAKIHDFFNGGNQALKQFDLITVIHSVYEFSLSEIEMHGELPSRRHKSLQAITDLLSLGNFLASDGLLVVIIESKESAFAKVKKRLFPKFHGTWISEDTVEDTLKLAGLGAHTILSKASVRNKFHIKREHLTNPAHHEYPAFLLQSATSDAEAVSVQLKAEFGHALARYLRTNLFDRFQKSYLRVDDAVFIVDLSRMKSDANA